MTRAAFVVLAALLCALAAAPARAFTHDIPLGQHVQLCVACASIPTAGACAAECACGWCGSGTGNSTVGHCVDAATDLDSTGPAARPAACPAGAEWHSDAREVRCDVYPASVVAGLAVAFSITASAIILFVIVRRVRLARARARALRNLHNDDMF